MTPEENDPNWMAGILSIAEAEIMRKVSGGAITMPSEPVAAARLLCEHFLAAMKNLRPIAVKLNPAVVISPVHFVHMLILLVFEDRIGPSANWPFSKAEVRTAFKAMGLTGDYGLGFPLGFTDLLLLIGPEQHSYTQVVFSPSFEDLWLTEMQAARVSTQIKRERGGVSTAISATANLALVGQMSVSITASSDGGKSEFRIPSRVIQTETAIADITGPGEDDTQTLVAEEHGVFYDDSTARTTARLTSDGVSFERDVKLRKKRKSKGRLEEKTIGIAFISVYNKVAGAELQVRQATANEDDEKKWDMIAIAPDGSMAFPIQIIKCGNEAMWAALGSDGSYSDRVTEAQAISEIMKAVHMKSVHSGYSDAVKAGLVLLLDGAWTSFTAAVPKSIVLKHSTELANAGFKEIWYASRVSGEGYRLFPE